MMKRILLFTLVNTYVIHNVSSLKPNVFFKRARIMTKNIGGNVYKRTKTAIIPIVAKIKNTNCGFYEGKSLYKSNNNEYTGYNYNDYLQSTTKYSNPQQMTCQQQHVSDGLYQDYRNSLTGTQNYQPAPAYSYIPPPSAPVYEPPSAPVYLPPSAPVYASASASAPIYAQPSAPAPVPASLYAPPPSAPAPNNHGLAMSRYAPVPAPVQAPTHSYAPVPAPVPPPVPAPVPAPVPVPVSVPVSVPAPVPVAPATEKKEYSTEGLYEEYRKSLQKTNQVSESIHQSSRNTATGFYGGPNKSLEVKHDTVLYEPPTVVKSPPQLSGNRYTGNGFYQGR